MHMNHLLHHRVCRALWLALSIAGILPVQNLRAEPPTASPDERYLFVFDTASTMKKRVPMVQKVVNEIFLTGMHGQINRGDTIGAWTFADQTHTGRFPLQSWLPEDAAVTASNLNAFVKSQHYAKQTHFESLMPVIDQVVQSSERLTVLIFCDGNGEIAGTPYDKEINELFKRSRPERQQNGQPMVIVLRSQQGQYVGCRGDLPPQQINIPPFPPLPVPTHEIEVATNPPAPAAPRAPTPPLIIIWPKHTVALTNRPPPATNTSSSDAIPATAPQETGSNPATTPPTASTEIPAVQTSTNPAAAPSNVAAQAITNQVAASTAGPGADNNGMILIAVALLGVAGLLAFFIWRRSHMPQEASLISQSMGDKKTSPPEK